MDRPSYSVLLIGSAFHVLRTEGLGSMSVACSIHEPVALRVAELLNQFGLVPTPLPEGLVDSVADRPAD